MKASDIVKQGYKDGIRAVRTLVQREIKKLNESTDSATPKNIGEQWIADTIDQGWDEMEDQFGKTSLNDIPHITANLMDMFSSPEDWEPSVFAPCKDIPAAMDAISMMGEEEVKAFMGAYLKAKIEEEE